MLSGTSSCASEALTRRVTSGVISSEHCFTMVVETGSNSQDLLGANLMIVATSSSVAGKNACRGVSQNSGSLLLRAERLSGRRLLLLCCSWSRILTILLPKNSLKASARSRGEFELGIGETPLHPRRMPVIFESSRWSPPVSNTLLQ